ncbi:hypothetical protein BBK36DRAFT_18422 [Trichoderma citrinoviride]|uniref:DDE-1 domain-containing protein n=1 Tax=Trichoderma citrinoviride TaxID=58853 RepID=A0A2T4BF97_9HYPO|nr:hypothetical protein BBK36DRAFT_18422 [Trichoderma citrinoviride]PTB68012.1 hypothetical protein BBK36DRAFT_18422 [Trichoderma citrinoviride]
MADELPPAFKAATAVLADRDRPPRLRKPLSIRCAERFSVSPSAVKRALATLTNPEPVSRSPRPAGRPRALARDEDELLISYVLWLQRGGFPMAKAQLVAAANDLRRRKNPEAGDLGKNWYSRWLSEQPELADTYARIQDMYSKGGGADKGIKSTEASNVERVMTYFDNLKKIIALHRIGPSECWNEDEGSLRVGCLGDEVQVIVVRTTRSQVLEPSNQEPSSLIGVANAAGESIAPFVVFKTLPFNPEPVSNAVGGNGVHFAQSETGFSNADISLEWLHHFNYWSWKKSIQAQRSGKELEDWFGYDMWLRDPESPWKPPQKISRIQRPEEERIYRLLVLDGSAGHTSLDFIEYCMKFDIIVAIIPSDFHYILQPLDLGVLQPLKHAYQRLLQNTLDTHSSFTQPDFIKAFKGYTRKDSRSKTSYQASKKPASTLPTPSHPS